jgi:hypothetical protein
MENVLKLVYFVMVVATMFGAFAIVTFSTVRQVQQPTRSLFLGLGSSAIAALASMPLLLFDSPSVWLWMVSIGILTTGIGGGPIGLIGSGEGINAKTKDDFAPKRGYDKWYGGWGGWGSGGG